MPDPDIIFERCGALGLVLLNRPEALNALNLSMVRQLDRRLRAWVQDDAIKAVAVRGTGGRAFCAGGDIRALCEFGRSGQKEEAIAFWREEYRLNYLIKTYPKPYVALIEGVVMGGGVGLSVHGSHRVAAEKVNFAMPEVGIGFFPDVGATFFLPRLRQRTGTWLALTGARLGTADVLALDIATHHVPVARFDHLIAALTDGEPVDDLLRRETLAVGSSEVIGRLPAIERLFGGDSVETILNALDAERGPHAEFAKQMAGTIRTKSPTSLKLTFEQIRRGAESDFAECLRIEFRLASRILDHFDFYEGVRAVIVDKDNKPRWQPPRLEEVGEDVVGAYFAPLLNDELSLEDISMAMIAGS